MTVIMPARPEELARLSEALDRIAKALARRDVRRLTGSLSN